MKDSKLEAPKDSVHPLRAPSRGDTRPSGVEVEVEVENGTAIAIAIPEQQREMALIVNLL